MMSKFVRQIKSKKQHKVYSIDIGGDEHVTELCKFLKKHTDRKLELILNGKRIMFDSIAGRKKFAAGFEGAFVAIEPYMEKYVKNLYDKMNKLTNEIAAAKHDTAQVRRELNKEREVYRVKRQVIGLRKAAYDDHLEEWKDNCITLQQRVKELEAKQTGKPRKPRQRRIQKPAGKTSVPK